MPFRVPGRNRAGGRHLCPARVLLQDGVRTSRSVNSRISTPGCMSSCKSPVETGLAPRFYATTVTLFFYTESSQPML